MATHEFDKGVQIPTTVARPGVNIDMLRAMEVGDSKWWPAADAKKATRFYRVAKRLGIPILIRKVGTTDVRGPGVRMWRVDDTFRQTQEVDAIARSEAAALRKTESATKPPAARKVVPKAATAPKKVARAKPSTTARKGKKGNKAAHAAA